MFISCNTPTARLALRALLALAISVVSVSDPRAAETDAAAETPGGKPLIPDAILVSDAVQLALPAFHEAERAGVSWDDLLTSLPSRPGDDGSGVVWPADGRGFAGPDGMEVMWRKQETTDGTVTLEATESAAARYLAFAVTSDRWQEITLTVAGNHDLRGVCGGQDLVFEESEGQDGAPTKRSVKITSPVGKHLVVLRSLRHSDSDGAWAFTITITPGDDGAVTTLGTTPDRSVDIHTVLDAPRVSNAALSPDGSLVALSLGEYRNGTDHERWLEVRETGTGRLVDLWRGDHAPGRIAWHPEGRRVTWQTTHDDKATLRIFDLDTGETAVVLADVSDLVAWRWAPDGRSIVYGINREAKADERKVKRVANPADRQPWWRNRSHLMQVFVPGGVTRRLTAGPVSAENWEIAPDGQHMIFFMSEQDLTRRPYSTSTLYLMDLKTLTVEQILNDPWIGDATWSPDGMQLLLRGSPSAFDGLGRNLPDEVQANDYGGQLYLFDLETRQPEAVTLDLRPDVNWSVWSPADGMIYARCTDTQFVTVWRMKPGKAWERVETGVEACSQLAVARDARVAVARGSGGTNPNTVHVVDLKKNRSRLLLDPGATWYQDVVFGKIEPWVAKLEKGMDLDGFVYYPPGFNPGRSYPVIVYYYGGTAPIDRSFGGRYPKNIWAGQDYIVYVPNPSGATGYGQEFAARHVNDWGRLTAPEVIEGTEKFLAAHPFADPDRVGCMGASYGGFLTMYVVTQTDLFAAAVSHAGISDITSYWGEGFWGYSYGARALANSFPWADQDLYVGQSSLFQADRITTPLLLVHGDVDTNVPKGESDQLFTALKMLGKEVEYVQIVGQNHHILDHEQRIVWNDTILAFLAKYLKGRPEWWEAMYPAPTDWR